jgi:hypothetical protein
MMRRKASWGVKRLEEKWKRCRAYRMESFVLASERVECGSLLETTLRRIGEIGGEVVGRWNIPAAVSARSVPVSDAVLAIVWQCKFSILNVSLRNKTRERR